MNPFDRIREYRSVVLSKIGNTIIQSGNTLTYEEHYRVLLNFLKMLEEDLKNAKYDYVVKKINTDGETFYGEYNGITFQSYPLSDDILVFQPLFVEEGEISSTDVDSLIEALTALKEHGRIRGDILVIPPGMNVLKAVLAESDRTEEASLIEKPDIKNKIAKEENMNFNECKKCETGY